MMVFKFTLKLSFRHAFPHLLGFSFGLFNSALKILNGCFVSQAARKVRSEWRDDFQVSKYDAWRWWWPWSRLVSRYGRI